MQGLIKLLPVLPFSESNWRRWSTKMLENIKKGEHVESRELGMPPKIEAEGISMMKEATPG